MRPTLAQASIADGRPDSAVRDLKKRLIEQRLVSIVCPGGLERQPLPLRSRTTGFPNSREQFSSLTLRRSRIHNSSVRRSHHSLGCPSSWKNPLSVILAFLRERRVLLVFDGCERVIEATAALAEKIFRDAPQVQILATSRAPHDEVQHGCVRWRVGSHPAAVPCGLASSRNRLLPPSELGLSSEPTTSNLPAFLSSLSSGNRLNGPRESTSLGCESRRSFTRVVRVRAPNIVVRLAGRLACEKRAA
jgi:hypothetical protein